MASGGKQKAKTKGGSGSANDKRGGIAKAKESAERGAGDRAGGGDETRGGSGARSGASGKGEGGRDR